MPAPVRIILSQTEDLTLQELSVADGVPRRTKLRAIALRLNADGWNVTQIAEHSSNRRTRCVKPFDAGKVED